MVVERKAAEMSAVSNPATENGDYFWYGNGQVESEIIAAQSAVSTGPVMYNTNATAPEEPAFSSRYGIIDSKAMRKIEENQRTIALVIGFLERVDAVGAGGQNYTVKFSVAGRSLIKDS